MDEKRVDVAIIGAGIAGLTAAIYARRANRKVLILEEKTYGGQILATFTVGNWPGEPDISGIGLMKKIYTQATNLGAEILYEKVVSVRDFEDYKEIRTSEGTSIRAQAVIVATGTVDKPMGVPGEEKFFGRGISYCATCDGAFYKGKSVVVVGGGNSALYNALYLADVCEKVYVVHRRAEFRADAMLVDKVAAKGNVEFVMGANPLEVLGEEELTGLLVEVGGEKREILAAGIFVAVGKKPATELFADLVERDEAGYIVAGEDCMTSCDGIFVAGDCRTKCTRQLITAAADGAVAGNAGSAACTDEI